MMSYPLQSKPRKNINLRRAIKITVGLIVAVLLLNTFLPNVTSTIVSFVSKPLWRGEGSLSAAIRDSQIFRTRANLLAEVERLQNENSTLRDRALLADILSADNVVLREMLGSGNLDSGIGALVLVSPTQTIYDNLIVDIFNNIVSVGDKAVYGNVAIGTVIKEGNGLATVDMYSSNGRETVGRLLSTGTSIVLSGKGGGNFQARVPRDMPINQDEIIILPGNPSSALARVGQIEESETDSFKLIRLSLPVNMFELRWVEIIHENQ